MSYLRLRRGSVAAYCGAAKQGLPKEGVPGRKARARLPSKVLYNMGQTK